MVKARRYQPKYPSAADGLYNLDAFVGSVVICRDGGVRVVLGISGGSLVVEGYDFSGLPDDIRIIRPGFGDNYIEAIGWQLDISRHEARLIPARARDVFESIGVMMNSKKKFANEVPDIVPDIVLDGVPDGEQVKSDVPAHYSPPQDALAEYAKLIEQVERLTLERDDALDDLEEAAFEVRDTRRELNTLKSNSLETPPPVPSDKIELIDVAQDALDENAKLIEQVERLTLERNAALINPPLSPSHKSEATRIENLIRRGISEKELSKLRNDGWDIVHSQFMGTKLNVLLERIVPDVTLNDLVADAIAVSPPPPLPEKEEKPIPGVIVPVMDAPGVPMMSFEAALQGGVAVDGVLRIGNEAIVSAGKRAYDAYLANSARPHAPLLEVHGV